MTENVHCKELFELFTKMGGRLSCNYNNKKCIYITTIPKNITTCNITEEYLCIKLQKSVMEPNDKIEKFYNYKDGTISEFIVYSTNYDFK